VTVQGTDIERVFRAEYGRAVSVLVRGFGDIDLAEDAVQDAFTEAVRRWPGAGIPPSPAGWIITTARNRAIDRLRREASRDGRQAEAARLHQPTPSRTRSWCRSQPWRSGWSGPRAKSATRGSRTGYPATPNCPPGSAPCWPWCT
jgi:RNA polymerase sigma-70 factor (ECF subfamily)